MTGVCSALKGIWPLFAWMLGCISREAFSRIFPAQFRWLFYNNHAAIWEIA
jgi:hypothetical protein